MAEGANGKHGRTARDMRTEAADKAGRKLKARGQEKRTLLSGMGLFGLIGWSIALPTLLGAAAGWWLDRRFPGERSWTVALIVAGLTLGCINAWRWVEKEQQHMHKGNDDAD